MSTAPDRTTRNAKLLACTLGLALAGCGANPEDPEGDVQTISAAVTPVATVSQHCSGEGWSVTLEPGHHVLDELYHRGFVNDDASSIRVPPGYQMTVYQDDFFGGFSAVFKNDVNCLTDTAEGRTDGRSWNDDISSIALDRLPDPPNAAAWVYENCWGAGGWQVALEPGGYTLYDLRSRGVINDDISMVAVGGDYQMRVFQHDDFGGLSTTFTSPAPCLVFNQGGRTDGRSWNDDISSLIIERRPAVALYQHCLFEGWSVSLDEGAYSLSDLQARGMLNDDASSFRVTPGYRITVYQHADFSGFSATFTDNEGCLAFTTAGRTDGRSWNDDLSSVVVERVGVAQR